MTAEPNLPSPPDNTSEIISYQQLRTFIGFIGLALPFAVVAGCYLHGDGNYSWQPSISHYYYSKVHIVFVCSLCVLGGFLITYKGKAKGEKGDIWESRVSNLAGYFALGVASFPTGFFPFRLNANGTNEYLQLMNPVNEGWSKVHFACAGGLFACFVLFCLWFFQKPDATPSNAEEAVKLKRRQLFYKICGYSIIISILGVAGFSFLAPHREGIWFYSTFIFETTALWFFGSAWLIKGSLALKNVPVIRQLIKPFR